jgi:acyl transferase domain-containing protein
MMSKDSVCYSFDERAGGYARGEGFGCLILKRLSQAIADGDTIRGVVRSTGVGQDGNTPSITSPSQTAQERLIRETYARAGLDLNETRYFEAHGTGTPVGDPCEAAAINNVFSTRTSDDPMFVGALKSNMGHPEGASGIAGVIKTILVLEKGIIPPNVYPERINPAVAVAGPNLKFPLEAAVWPIRGVRRASVNSFGYGGTNAHVVIDDALSFLTERGLDARHCTNRLEDIQETPKINEQFSDSASSDGSSYDTPTSDTCPSDMDDDQELAMINMPTRKLLVLSAFDERALQRYMHTLDGWTRRQSEGVDISALAYTLSEKRTSFPWKSVCVASANSISHLPWSAPTRVKPRVTVGLVFTGQGAQWHGMGRQLMKYEVFHNSLMDADTYFKSLGSTWSLLGK